MYKLYFYTTSSGRVPGEEFISEQDQETGTKIRNGIKLIQRYGLELLRTHWMKKILIKPNIYELRISAKKEIRVLFGYNQSTFIILHIFVKKSNKLPTKEKELVVNRIKQFTS